MLSALEGALSWGWDGREGQISGLSLLGTVLCELLNRIFEQAPRLFSWFDFYGKTQCMWVTKPISVQKNLILVGYDEISVWQQTLTLPTYRFCLLYVYIWMVVNMHGFPQCTNDKMSFFTLHFLFYSVHSKDILLQKFRNFVLLLAFPSLPFLFF